MVTAIVMVAHLQLPVLFAQTQSGGQTARSGQELYRAACAACHAANGRGASRAMVGFDIPLPDFTDCQFASREPDPDWVIVVHEGGPVRGFSEMMPAFGEALSVEEIQRIVSYIRGFCRQPAWPRGELNLPRPLITEKAFPEDEAVLTTTIDTEGSGAVTNDYLYERRYGARNQIELILPVSALRTENGGWRGGVGDITVGYKRALFHSLESGSIFSAGGEVILPTGNKDYSLGNGFTTFEAYGAFGQILPSNGFFHFQGGIEVQIYESIMADQSGMPTTGLLSAVRFVKDNRLLPRGFNKATADEDIAVRGGAVQDHDFNGGDRVLYSVALGDAEGPFQVEAELWYQPISYRWASNLREYKAAETERFVKYFDSMSSTSAVILARAEVVK